MAKYKLECYGWEMEAMSRALTVEQVENIQEMLEEEGYCVAKHNLERFHSECIVWAFNNSKKMLHSFIKKTAQNPDLNIKDAQG